MSAQFMSVLTLTLAATGTIAANRLAKVDGTQAGAGDNTLGAVRTAASSGDKVPCDVLGTTIVESGAAITAGDTLKSDGSGRAITWATSGAKVGIALQAATAAGQFIEVLLIPNVA
jgi:hypothetical protein